MPRHFRPRLLTNRCDSVTELRVGIWSSRKGSILILKQCDITFITPSKLKVFYFTAWPSQNSVGINSTGRLW